MAAPVALLAKAATLALTDEKARKGIGWCIVAILSPIIVLFALLCSVAAGTAEHNVSAAEFCFSDVALPADLPEEYKASIENMRAHFGELDALLEDIGDRTEGDESLDEIRVKAIFYALFFGAEEPAPFGSDVYQKFVDCFATFEETTGTITETDDDGNEVEVEGTIMAATPITDRDEIYQKLGEALGAEVTAEQKSNAESIYSLIKYGAPSGDESWETGDNAPFVGADGFCSPIGANWRSIVTSEFGYRIDPISGQSDGHSGMDLAVPQGTPVRAALSGTVIVAGYEGSYGNYVMIEHANNLRTVYAHCSQLTVHSGQQVQAGTVVALSGATGRVTGPHLHFEVRVNNQRTNPRYYLP